MTAWRKRNGIYQPVYTPELSRRRAGLGGRKFASGGAKPTGQAAVISGGGGPVTVTSVSPTNGLATTEVTITGTGFTNGQAVTIGGTTADNIVYTNSTTIVCDVPSGLTQGSIIDITVAGVTLSDCFYVGGATWLGNEPAGFTALASNDWDDLNAPTGQVATWTSITDVDGDQNIAAGQPNTYTGSGTYLYNAGSIQTDATALMLNGVTSSSVYQVYWPVGFNGGVGNHKAKMTFDQDYKQLYVCHWIMWDADFEWNVASHKMFYASGNHDVSSSFLFQLVGSEDGVNYGYPHIELYNNMPGNGNQGRMYDDVGGITGTQGTRSLWRGEWQLQEFLIKWMSASGAWDAEFHAWVNGTKYMTITGANTWDTLSGCRTNWETEGYGNDYGWNSLRYSNLWGGGGTMTRANYQYVAKTYVSGKTTL